MYITRYTNEYIIKILKNQFLFKFQKRYIIYIFLLFLIFINLNEFKIYLFYIIIYEILWFINFIK
jgi:hypothetical protein